MGLGPSFKPYLRDTFPSVVLEDAGDADGVVIDVMVLLHTFTLREEDEHDRPVDRLVGMFWNAICGYTRAALCFDVPSTTPSAKAIEWRNRPAPEIVVTSDDLNEWLIFDQIYEFKSVMASRQARMVLCNFLAKRLVERMRCPTWTGLLKTLIVFGDVAPVVYLRSGPQTPRPDWKRPLHGEADVSGIFAAHILKDKCRGVVAVTCDTDWCLVGALNAFPGLVVKLTHYDRKCGAFVSMFVDVNKLVAEVKRVYSVNLFEWAAVVLTRGSDYVTSFIRGIPDWHTYVSLLCNRVVAQKNRTKVAEVVSASALNGPLFFGALKQLVNDTQRTALKIDENDGELARLAWNLFYFKHVPLAGGAGLDCESFGGWQVDANGVVDKAQTRNAVFRFNPNE